MSRRSVVAVDLGAESGRVATVGFDGKRLDLDVRHRFTHEPLKGDGILRWDMRTLTAEVDAGLAAVSADGTAVDSVGVDTWGVDYGLLDADGALVDLPTCYRDPRQVRAMRSALAEVDAEALYDATGVQIIPINTVFGLRADLEECPDRIAAATSLLMMPDVLHHHLCGSTVSEYTAASTTGAYDMAHDRWSLETFEQLGIPSRLAPTVVPPGTDLGPLRGASGALRGARVVAPAGHDTASAVVGTPLATPEAMYISSGTWSLVGVEVREPVISAQTRRANLTNEGGYAGTVRLLRNVMGLWILQECRRQWAREGIRMSYAELVGLAQEPAAAELRTLIDPDAPEFLGHGDMPARIRAFCARAGLPVPVTPGQVARCIFDSLALSYARVADDLTAATGVRPPAVHVVGGGASNDLLAQLTADATGLPVHCGPVEATALGNAAVQLVAAGELDGLDQVREAVAASTELVGYQPRQSSRWSEAAATYAALPALEGT